MNYESMNVSLLLLIVSLFLVSLAQGQQLRDEGIPSEVAQLQQDLNAAVTQIEQLTALVTAMNTTVNALMSSSCTESPIFSIDSESGSLLHLDVCTNTTTNLGVVVGQDGKDGEPGQDGVQGPPGVCNCDTGGGGGGGDPGVYNGSCDSCPNGGTVMYYAATEAKIWSEHNVAAKAMGCELASITSATEQQEAVALLNSFTGYTYVYIGGFRPDEGIDATDGFQAGGWAWSDSLPWPVSDTDGYSNWDGPEPNDATPESENVVVLITSYTGAPWADYVATEALPALYKCCDFAPAPPSNDVVWYSGSSDPVWQVTDGLWMTAQQFCEQQEGGGKTLCSLDQICPGGRDTLPVGDPFGSSDSDVDRWVPVTSDVNCESNTWVQIGSWKPSPVDTGDRYTCWTHDEVEYFGSALGCPAWGLASHSSVAYTKEYVACC